MQKKKILIAIGLSLVLASVSIIYFLNQPKDAEVAFDKDVVQNNNTNDEAKNNDEIALLDDNENNSLEDITNNKSENGSVDNNEEGTQNQDSIENLGNSDVSDKPGNSGNSGGSGNLGNSDNSGEAEEPSNPGNPSNPGESEKPEVPEIPEEPENPVTEITLTKDDLVNGVVTISNKGYKNITLDSSLENSKVVLDNVELEEQLTLADGVQYEVEVKNSTIPYIKVGEKKLIRSANSLLDINKNISGPTLKIENVKGIENVDVNGNISINGDSEILNLNITSGAIFLDAPARTLTIDKDSMMVDVTINQRVNEVNDNGNGTSIGVNSDVDSVNLNGSKSNMFIKRGVTVEKATINGDATKVMGNGNLSSIEINGNDAGIYTETSKDNIVINDTANNPFIGREDKYEISSITTKKQGVIEFTLNEKTSTDLKLSDISIICQGGNSMTVFDITTVDNKTYTLNTSYFKDNTYELYITLPNGKIISKEFVYSYNHPTASDVIIDRTKPTEANIEVYGVDEGGYLYYKLVEKTTLYSRNNMSAEDIKKNGKKESIKTGYNDVAISSLEENKEYDVYYVMEGFDGRTSPVYGPITVGKYVEKPQGSEYKLDYAAEVEANKFVFTFNKAVKYDLKLEDFKIICPQEAALTTKGAKFLVSPDRKTYTIIVPDNYGHKDNMYVVTVNMPDGTVVEGSFRSHFNPPVISGSNIDRYAKDKIRFEFNSDEHGILLYGVYDWNNSIYAGDSNTPMVEDVLTGKIKGTEAKLNSGYNELDIDMSGYTLTDQSRLWVLFIDYDGNYRKGFVSHFKIPEFTGDVDGEGEEDKSSLEIVDIEVGAGFMSSILNLTFNEHLTHAFGQNDIKIQSLSGINLPSKIAMMITFPPNKPNYVSVELMGLKLQPGEYRITIDTVDLNGIPVKVVKEFTVA